MTPVSFLMLILAAPPAEVTTLSGGQYAGTIVKLTAKELSLQAESGPAQTILAAELLEVRLTGERAATPAGDDTPLVRIALTDGSVLHCQQVATSAKQLSARHPLLGELVLPLAAVRSVRFSPPSAKFDPLWQQLVDKTTKIDMVVLQKPEVLDHLDGVVGAIDEAAVKFLLDGDEITVKREKAFGIIYTRKPSNAKLYAKVVLANGDAVAVKSVLSDGEQWQVESIAGTAWTLPANGVAAVDFSLGKVVYLSTLEPRAVNYTPYPKFKDDSEFYWKFRRDRSLEGKPLRLAQKTYARGLAIHSKTELKYRLAGEYRRFQALLGIDDEITRYGATSIRILGDRQELYAGECLPRQPAIPLDLDVSNVTELDIIVDFGSDKLDIGDRIHLADAKLVK